MSLKAFLKSRQFRLHLTLVVAFIALFVYLTLILLKVYTHHGKSLAVPDFYGLYESDVKMVASENKLRYNIIDSLFVPDAIPGTVISQHPDLDTRVKQRRTIYLIIAAMLPEKVRLPSIVDISLRNAQSQLENVGLRLGKVEYRPSEFLNLVLDKSLNGKPLPDDTILAKGTEIDLVVGKGLSNEKTSVPNLWGMTLEDASEALYAISLNVGAKIYDQSIKNANDSVMAQIWKQKPNDVYGNLIELGSSVDLWLTIDKEKININSNEINESEEE